MIVNISYNNSNKNNINNNSTYSIDHKNNNKKYTKKNKKKNVNNINVFGRTQTLATSRAYITKATTSTKAPENYTFIHPLRNSLQSKHTVTIGRAKKAVPHQGRGLSCRRKPTSVRPSTTQKIPLFTAILVVIIYTSIAHGFMPCNSTDDCTRLYTQGSECILETGHCSNVFYKGGCLSNLLQNTNSNYTFPKYRVCSSADPQEAVQLGYCIPSSTKWNYTEIRILGNNWESVFFENWIVQILLSEMLGVPTSVDTGFRDKSIDFYDKYDRFDYGKGYDWDAMRLAQKVGDCRLVQQPADASQYISCGHVSLEVWEGQKSSITMLRSVESVIEKPSSIGVLGNAGWYIPRFTATRDPSLSTYLGLLGEENRGKLAERFKRPTSWIDYCNQVSATNCSSPDSIAMRPPADETESKRMFLPGLYMGHFRETADNDCATFPKTCTGHIVDYPCGWSSTVEQQTFHLKIALRSNGDTPYCGGYSYSQMVEIWNAANATKSDVIMTYWTPEALVQKYAGTDAEFIKVLLPPPTQKCYENRIKPIDRCQPNVTLRVGNADGVCDEEIQTLVKAVTSNLFDLTKNPITIPSEALRSPAYDAIQNFQLTNLQLAEIFDMWLKLQDSTSSSSRTSTRLMGAREAVCSWIVNNIDVVKTFIPRTYPRVLVDKENTFREPMFYISLVYAVAAFLFVAAVSVAVYKFRKRRAIVVSQVVFLFLLLAGLILVQLGAVALVVPPNNISCIFAVWAINLGYTLELVPLIVKVAAINKLMAAARQMKRAKIQLVSLLWCVAAVTAVMAIYLLVWTIIDPPRKTDQYSLTDRFLHDTGETIVERVNSCQSSVLYWSLSALIWRSVLLFWATILAFQTRNSPVNFNESKVLALMIYSQFSFLLWTLVLYFVQSKLVVSQVSRYQSLIHSTDVTLVCCIYFIPKLLTKDDYYVNAQRSLEQSKILSSLSQQVGTSTVATTHPRKSTSAVNGDLGSRSYFESSFVPVHNPIPEGNENSSSSGEVENVVHFDVSHSALSALAMENDDIDVLPGQQPLEMELTPAKNGIPMLEESQPSSYRHLMSDGIRGFKDQQSHQDSIQVNLSSFTLLKDHVKLSVQYLNYLNDRIEIIDVTCYDDPSKNICFRSEIDNLLERQIIDNSKTETKKMESLPGNTSDSSGNNDSVLGSEESSAGDLKSDENTSNINSSTDSQPIDEEALLRRLVVKSSHDTLAYIQREYEQQTVEK